MFHYPTPMFSTSVGQWTLSIHPDRLPDLYGSYVAKARLAEEFDLQNPQGVSCFLAVSCGTGWPSLVVAQRYDPSGGFLPSALLVPETGLLFLGAGERLLAYRLDEPTRLWIDTTAVGCWGWARFADRVILSAELELTAWDLDGRKCWSKSVEPPWGYEVTAGMVELDVMGAKSRFLLDTGPGRGPNASTIR